MWRSSSTCAQCAALPRALAPSGPLSGAVSTFGEHRAQEPSRRCHSTYPFDEEALLQDSSCLLHHGQPAGEMSPR